MPEDLPPDAISATPDQPDAGTEEAAGQALEAVQHAELLRVLSPEYQAGFWAMLNAQKGRQPRPAPLLEIIDTAGLAVPFREVMDADTLARVLNAALALDVAENPQHKPKPLIGKVLNYYAFHKKTTRYSTFEIPKRTRGEMRVIKAPDHGLRRIQRLLLLCLTAAFTTCDKAAHGFVPGRSVLTNAQPHAGRRFVLNLDLKDFFTNTHYGRVERVLQLPPFSLLPAVARLVANLCCDQGSLPQGAPTSPLLTNAVCQRLDRRLRQLAKCHRATYTRYADDLTFSSQRPAFREPFYAELKVILDAEGYQENAQKRRLQLPNARQEVTGIVVNDQPNVPREYVRQIRAMLHNWETKGYEAASTTLRAHYRESKAGARHKGTAPKLEQVLAGKIAYLGMVRGSDSVEYTVFSQKLKSLGFDKENLAIMGILKVIKEKGVKEAIASKQV
ncbi:reverse transcriptase domain-containing protein [Hymenobacter elongatus]|uniref:RNA-directed DNA polymerase n=1 Tax=Hymenobacter elongatus TaxID=877208 RepID=A0A4Z0PKM5_9BACT|nr:reverse transcriptase domain-containing protein [Hymenobacter elongatus]TGE15974.1 RNA-directed DNA polymerase [Hymenobacter elongatus]